MPDLKSLSKLKAPPSTTHLENGVVEEGAGLKRKRGRPKKIPQANPEKLLKGLSKRLTKKQKEEPKKEVEIPLSYKHSTPPAIKVDLAPKPAPPAPPAPPTPPTPPKTPKPPKAPKPTKQEEVSKSRESTPKISRRSRSQTPSRHLSPVAPRNLPTHTPTKTPVGKAKKAGIEELSGSRQLQRLQRIAEDQAKDDAKLAKAHFLLEVKEGKKLAKVGSKVRTKRDKELEKEAEKKESEGMFKEDKAGKQAEDAIATIQKALGSEKSPPRVLEVDEKWGLNPANKEAVASKPYYSGKGRHSAEYRAWLIANPTAPSAIHWFKTTDEGKAKLKELNLALPEPKAVGRPKKQAPPAKTPAVLAYEERHAPAKAELPPATRTTNVLSTARRVTSLLKPPSEAVKAYEDRKKAEGAEEPEPPSRILPVVEDAKATAVYATSGQLEDVIKQRGVHTATGAELKQLLALRKAEAEKEEYEDELETLTELYGEETALRLLSRPAPPSGLEGELSRLNKTEGSGIDFKDINWGSLTAQMKHHPEMKSLEQFSNHILANPKEFHKRTVKRANFYKNVIGKGIYMDSDSSSSDSGDEEIINIKNSFNKGSGLKEIISHHNIMPMTRPVGLHPALESSTMTMNPGAYNNIKPLMGALMGGGVSHHIRRTDMGGQTMSHYGDHALHPQMMPMGHYTKHIMKGGAVMPTMNDLLSHGVKHLKDMFGTDPEQAHTLLHTALHTADIPKELHPLAHYGLSKGLKSLVHTMGGSIGGAFWQDLGSKLGHAFTGVGDIVKDTAYDVGDQIKAEAPGLLKQTNEVYNDPRTQAGIAGVTTALSEAGLPEVGIPLKIANVGISNALDAGANHRNVKQQLEHRYVSPAKSFLNKLGIKGMGAGKDLGKNLAENTGRLADSGTNYLIRQMDGHGLYAQSGGKVGQNLAKNLAENTGRLADSGTDYLIRQMDGHGLFAQGGEVGGKVGRNLAKNLAHNVGRLADSGSDYLIRKMGGEVGDGLYAQGRGVRHPKGSQEAKDHMAKLRAMRGKGKGLSCSKDSKDKPKPSVEPPQLSMKEIDRRLNKHLTEKAMDDKGGLDIAQYEKLLHRDKHKPAKLGKGLKKMKGGDLPPRSRTPVTNPVIAGNGLY